MRRLLTHWFQEVDELLRGEKTRPQMLADRGLEVGAGRLMVAIVVMGMIYGLCMGSYSLLKEIPPQLANRSDRYMQVLASVVKTPALFFLTLLVTMPSLYVFNALVGSRLGLANLFKLLITSLVINTTVLASLGPIVAFFSLTTSSHSFIVLLNVAVFSVAGVLGLLFLLQTLHRLTNLEQWRAHEDRVVRLEPSAGDERPTDETNVMENLSALDMPTGDVLARHTRTVFRCWVVLFALVGAQMSWVLRPFIGTPSLPFEWFRERQSNFFTAVLNTLRELLFGGG
ncbi:MAG: hypothetical protein WD851_13500 [Pirellulales bacterium]